MLDEVAESSDEGRESLALPDGQGVEGGVVDAEMEELRGLRGGIVATAIFEVFYIKTDL